MSTSTSFTGLSIIDAEVPQSRVSLADNPAYEAMKDSASKRTDKGDGTWEGKGKAVTVDAAQAVKLEGFIRQAAEALKVGSMIRLRTPDEKIVEVKSVGGTSKTDPKTKKVRKTGGKPTAMLNGKPYTGQVQVFFRAKSPRKVAPKKTTAAPAAPARSAAAASN